MKIKVSLAVVSVVFMGTMETRADAPNIFEPKQMSTEDMRSIFLTCVDGATEANPGANPMGIYKYCGCITDYYRLKGHNPDVATMRTCMRHSERVKGIQKPSTTPYSRSLHWPSEMIVAGTLGCEKEVGGLVTSGSVVRLCGCFMDSARSKKKSLATAIEAAKGDMEVCARAARVPLTTSPQTVEPKTKSANVETWKMYDRNGFAVYVPLSKVADAHLRGGLAFERGSRVNVVDPVTGNVYNVDAAEAEKAFRAGLRPATKEDIEQDMIKQEFDTTPKGMTISFVYGVVKGATATLSDEIINDVTKKTVGNAREYNPGLHGTGMVTGCGILAWMLLRLWRKVKPACDRA